MKKMMNRFIYIFVLFLFTINNSLVANVADNNHPYIFIDKLNNKSKKVSSLFFGVNSLYWIDDDKSRKSSHLTERLKDLNIAAIRYPGGEIADNFNWKTNTLNDKNSFPYSRNINDAKTRMDFDEFVTWKNSLGAEAIIVVNLENGFIENDLEKAANLAAEWVRYANIEKKYKIKYWEIGNESYHLATRYALTSNQYAKALKLFSKKMKAVDPSIKIGAIGPFNVKDTPLIDVLSPREIRDLRSRKTSKQRKAFKKGYKKSFIRSPHVPSWWETVVKYSGNSFDFAVIHRYTPLRKNNSQMKRVLRIKQQVNNLERFLEKKLYKEVPIAVTEYNVAGKSKLEGVHYSLTMAEMFGNYLESGAFTTNYWPLRLKSKRSMIGFKSFKREPVYHVFKAFSDNVGNKVLTSSTDHNMLYTVSTLDTRKDVVTLFIVNKSNKSKNMDIDLPYTSVKAIGSYEINQRHSDLRKLKYLPNKINKHLWKFEVSPLSLTILKFKITDL